MTSDIATTRHGPRGRRKPGFGWHAAWILLPVAALAGFGLVSLRQDRLLAEQQAKESARVLVEAVSSTVGRNLELAWSEYQRARSMHEAATRSELDADKSPPPVDRGADGPWVTAWQQRHPTLVLAAQPHADLTLTAEGHVPTSLAGAVDGRPPRWLLALPTEARRAWHGAQVTLAAGQTNEARREWEQLLATPLPEEAKANVEFLLVSLPRDAEEPGETVASLRAMSRRYASVPSETGFPLGQLALLRALQRLPSSAGLDPADVAWVVQLNERATTSLVDVLLQELARVARSETTADQRKLAAARQLVASRRRTLEAAADAWGGAVAWKEGVKCQWFETSGSWFLAVAGPTGLAEASDRDGETKPSEANGVRVLFCPEAVVTAALGRAGSESPAVPRYARLRVRLGNHDFEPGPTGVRRVGRAEWPWLAEASGRWLTAEPWGASEVPVFHVRLGLADPAGLYARQQQRVWLFGALIVTATAVALAGILAANRAFVRQLRLNEMKSNFVSSVSHELRAPIASVRLLAESLDRGKVTDETRRRDYYRLIGQECRRLSALIENVLDFARLDQGRKQYAFDLTDLGALVQQTCELLAPYAAEHDVTLRLDMPPDLQVQARLDGRAIQQALVNLIDNAVKHSPSGGAVSVALEVRGAADPGGDRPATETRAGRVLVLSVADQGPGIPAQEQTRIFEPFYRRGSELRRETSGVGIGLTLVKHIVDAHGGRVSVESELGRGSRFVIVLPIEGNEGELGTPDPSA